MNLLPLAFVCVLVLLLNACASPSTAPSGTTNPDATLNSSLSAAPTTSPSPGTSANDRLRTLWENGAQWDEAMASIRSGSPEGLALYRELRAVSDAGATDDLNLAIVSAIEKNATGAMIAIQDADTPNVADCGKTDESDDDTRPARELALNALPKVRARFASLSRVKAGTIPHGLRLKCVKEMRRAIASWEKALR